MRRSKQRAQEARVSDRGKPEQFQGANAEIVRGVNTMLDAILLPIAEGNRILIQVSNGKIDELIAQTYKGDHEKMKQAINNVALVLQGLQKELARLLRPRWTASSPGAEAGECKSWQAGAGRAGKGSQAQRTCRCKRQGAE